MRKRWKRFSGLTPSEPSLDPINVVVFARRSFRIIACSIAEDAVADAHKILVLDAGVFQDGFAFLGLEDLLGSVYPAGAQAFGMSGIQQVTTRIHRRTVQKGSSQPR